MRKSLLRAGAVLVSLLPLFSTAAVTRNWVGSVNSLWSEPNNWSPAGVPTSADTLVFPAKDLSMTNDLPAGTEFGPLLFEVSGTGSGTGNITLNGNAMTLMGDLKNTGPYAQDYGMAPTLTVNAPIKIGAAITIGEARDSYASIDVNGQTLSFDPVDSTTVTQLSGSGTVNIPGEMGIEINGSSGFSGTIRGVVDVSAWTPNASIMPGANFHSALSGNGNLGDVNVAAVSPGVIGPGDDWVLSDYTYVIGTIVTKSFSVSTYSFFDLAPFGNDLIDAHGTVTIGGELQVYYHQGTPVPGQRFIIIQNEGKDPINGTFTGLPEGSIVQAHQYFYSPISYPYRITYVGGDGNDVELIPVADSSAAASQNAASSVIGEPVTISVAVSSLGGVPSGPVTFTDNGSPLGSAPLVNGIASLTVSTLGLGSHSIIATYAGFGGFLGSVASPISHTVGQGETTTSVEGFELPLLYGASRFRIVTAAKAPAAGTVSGTVTLREGTTVLGSYALGSGSVILNGSSLRPGTHTLTASYAGSSTFLGSDSTQTVFTIDPAPAKIDAWTDAPPSSDGSLILNISIFALTDVPDVPTGTVTISDNGVVLVQRVITSAASVPLKLTSGHHGLTISYSGDENFRPGTATFDEDVTVTPASRHRGVRH
ncbi:MAG TPA: Ig-like domain-containing protein [Vicinamibacterales bacterium]